MPNKCVVGDVIKGGTWRKTAGRRRIRKVDLMWEKESIIVRIHVNVIYVNPQTSYRQTVQRIGGVHDIQIGVLSTRVRMIGKRVQVLESGIHGIAVNLRSIT